MLSVNFINDIIQTIEGGLNINQHGDYLIICLLLICGLLHLHVTCHRTFHDLRAFHDPPNPLYDRCPKIGNVLTGLHSQICL